MRLEVMPQASFAPATVPLSSEVLIGRQDCGDDQQSSGVVSGLRRAWGGLSSYWMSPASQSCGETGLCRANDRCRSSRFTGWFRGGSSHFACTTAMDSVFKYGFLIDACQMSPCHVVARPSHMERPEKCRCLSSYRKLTIHMRKCINCNSAYR